MTCPVCGTDGEFKECPSCGEILEPEQVPGRIMGWVFLFFATVAAVYLGLIFTGNLPGNSLQQWLGFFAILGIPRLINLIVGDRTGS